ncbi:hypothetical protein GCM10010503_37450 [Streptomyces lucensis JCM 4490]|uniref:Uncharacterized protein n=1 Tax=Streptomyces lucensis JCM 4490 TaxID=1306176 RepID=A0A918J8U1_9ACTN|nr:hypothetical protein GCM10010503_37450 [Streptomyces lucensis JCM 4490]
MRESAGEATGVGDQLEVDQNLLQTVLGHSAQDREVQGGGAQRTVLHLAAAVPGGSGGGEVQAAAQVGAGEGGHHDAVIRRAAIRHCLREEVSDDLLCSRVRPACRRNAMLASANTRSGVSSATAPGIAWKTAA